jgi:F0F1-type ATP synthase assembly protein I
MQQSPRSVALRSAVVVLIALGLVVAGILVDSLTGSGPVATISSLVVGIVFGTVMILVIVLSSFPKVTDKQQSDPTDVKGQGR